MSREQSRDLWPPGEGGGATTPGSAGHHRSQPSQDQHPQHNGAGGAPWRRQPGNRGDAAWLTVMRVIVPPRLRSRLRHLGHEGAALRLDRFCREDTP